MAITVSFAVIHKITKETSSNGSLDVSQISLNNNDNKAINFVQQLDDRLRANYHFATFSHAKKTHVGSFEAELDSLVTHGFLQLDLLGFTKNQSKILLELLNQKPTSRGGYIIFSIYEINGVINKQYFGVFIVRDKNDITIEKSLSTRSYMLTALIHVDLDALAMACRIDLTAKKEGKERYIRFFRYRRQDVSDYFMNWIAAEPLETSKEDTKVLIDLLYTIPTPISKTDGISMSRDIFLQSAQSIIEAANKNVNLPLLSAQLFNQEGGKDVIQTFAEAQGKELASEFTANPSMLNRLKRLSITTSNIRLSFPPGMLREDIIIDRENPDRVIIKSKELADKIRVEKNSYAN